MEMRVHELHPSIVHFPLALLPSAVAFDMAAVMTDSPTLEQPGRLLWWAGAVSGLVAGVAGMAASQEVKAEERRTRDMMFLHGMGNVAIVTGAFGFAAWRQKHPPSLLSGILGLAACGVAIYTAYLGGEMVYAHGLGVRGLNVEPEELEQRSPLLLSREAPRYLLRDAVRGAGWLLTQLGRVFTKREKIEPGAYRGLSPEALPEAGFIAPTPELRLQ